jgi:hypothetical protein
LIDAGTFPAYRVSSLLQQLFFNHRTDLLTSVPASFAGDGEWALLVFSHSPFSTVVFIWLAGVTVGD